MKEFIKRLTICALITASIVGCSGVKGRNDSIVAGLNGIAREDASSTPAGYTLERLNSQIRDYDNSFVTGLNGLKFSEPVGNPSGYTTKGLTGQQRDR